MKTKLFYLMLMISLLCFTSCSNEKDEFYWPLESIYGTWNMISFENGGNWFDLTSPELSHLQASATFFSEGKVYYTGSMGTGYRTYKAYENKIRVNAGKDIKITYEVVTLNGNQAEVYINNMDGRVHARIKKR